MKHDWNGFTDALAALFFFFFFFFFSNPLKSADLSVTTRRA